MSKVPKNKSIPRAERKHSRARVFSLNFLENMYAHDSKCFVPLEDYRSLFKKYKWLVARRRKELNRIEFVKNWIELTTK